MIMLKLLVIGKLNGYGALAYIYIIVHKHKLRLVDA
jgi:hypothetical protein